MTRYRVVLERVDGARSTFAEVDADDVKEAALRLFVQAARTGGPNIPPEYTGRRYPLEDHRMVLEEWSHEHEWFESVAEGTFGAMGRFFA